MSATCIRNLGQWGVAPLAVVALSYLLSSRQSVRQSIAPPRPSAQETIGVPQPKQSSWHRAKEVVDPLRRIQATWAVIEETDHQGQESLFRQALEDEDHEGLAMLGETWLARDPTHFIEALSDIAIRASSPPVFQTQMDQAFRFWMNAEPKKAFLAFLKLNHQSQLVLGGSGSLSLAGDLLLSYTSKNPAAVLDIDLIAFAPGVGRGFTSGRYGGDVEALAHGLSQRSLDDAQTKGLLGFFQSAIRTNSPTEETNQRYLTWWRALPEAMQLETIPWDASLEILSHPGIRESLARQAMDDVSQVPLYMAHYGKAWATDTPQESLEWVLERYRDQALEGLPFPLTPSPIGSSRIRVNFDNIGHDSMGFYDPVSIPIRSIAASNPQQALEALENLPNPYMRSRIAPMIAQEWAKSDRDAALEWSESLPGSYARNQARALIMRKPHANGFGFGPLEIAP
jgi:hypothetical protein